MVDSGKRLEKVVLDNDAELLKQELAKGADVNIILESGLSLLGTAVKNSTEEIVQILIEAQRYLPDDWLQGNRDKLTVENFDWGLLKNNDQPENVLNADNADYRNQQGLRLFNILQKSTIPRNGCDVNFRDFHDKSPIHYAVERQNVNMVQMLLKAGCCVNVSDNKDSTTPLHIAVRLGLDAVVELLLNAGSLVNCRIGDTRTAALHIASSRGYLSIVRLLLNKGAHIDILDSYEQTPLLIAIIRKHTDVAELLISKKARINIEDMNGENPLSVAVWTCNVRLVSMLLKHGATITHRKCLLHCSIRQKSFPVCELLINHGALPDNYDNAGATPVQVAICTKQLNILELLLRNGCSTEVKCLNTGKTAVHAAVENISESDGELFSLVLDLLLRYGANINEESFMRGDTPLYSSITNDKLCFAEELIRQGCNPNLGHLYSCSFDNLYFVIQKKSIRCVKLLIYSGFVIQQLHLDTIGNYHESSEIANFITSVKQNALSLVKLCRIAIRQRMGSNLIVKVNRLPLPEVLRNYLLFKDKEFF